MPPQPISSSLNFLFKFILPAFWISTFGSATLALWEGKMKGSDGLEPGEPVKYLFLLLFIAGIVVAFVSYAPLKRVRWDDKNLYISNYREEITVPFSAIADVRQKTWLRGWNFPVTVVFRVPTVFGAKIKFVPCLGTWGFNLPHPIVGELRRQAGL